MKAMSEESAAEARRALRKTVPRGSHGEWSPWVDPTRSS